jgi:DNA polymerase elongation subunit (family B)
MHDHKEKLPPYFIGHYIAGFDLKFIMHRAMILGVKPPFPINFNGRHRSDFFCTMQEWAGYRDTVSLDNLCKYFGIEGKGDVDGSMVWDMVLAREFDKLDEYVRDDVAKVKRVYRKQTFGG